MNNKQDIAPFNTNLFKEMLKMRRREMSLGVRKRTQSPRATSIWLYPYAYERVYTEYLYGLMDVYSKGSIPVIRESIQRWTEEQKADSRMDDFNTEFQQLINSLQKDQYNMFDPDGTGITDDKGNFFSNAAIYAALTKLGTDIAGFNNRQFGKITKIVLGQAFNPIETWLGDVINVWADANFGLIKSLTDEYIKKLNVIVREGVLDGRPWDNIMKDLRGMNKNITKSRAKLLARDQTGKLQSRLSKKRSQEAGLDLYQWLTAGDERVRPSHKKLANKICRWDDNTVYADSVGDAQRGNWKSRSGAGMYVGVPGQDIQCRCTSIPVYDEIISEIDNELEKEGGY